MSPNEKMSKTTDTPNTKPNPSKKTAVRIRIFRISLNIPLQPKSETSKRLHARFENGENKMDDALADVHSRLSRHYFHFVWIFLFMEASRSCGSIFEAMCFCCKEIR